MITADKIEKKLMKKAFPERTFGRCKKCGELISAKNTILKNVTKEAIAKGKIYHCDSCYYFD